MSSTRVAVRGLAVFAALTLALAACEETIVDDEGITVTVSPQNVTLDVGETTPMLATVSNTTNQGVTWASNNAPVATVDAAGLVTAVGEGTAVITATSTEDASAVGQASVTVNPPPTLVVTVSPATPTIQVGQTVPLTAQVSNTTNQAVTWTSLTPAIATVDGSGVVTGVAAGTAIIQAAAQQDPNATGQATVTVLPEVPVTVVIQRIEGAEGGNVDPNNISGQIEVTIEFDAPPGSNVSGLEVLVDDVVICSQSIGSGEANPGDEAEAQTEVVCSIVTDAFDQATGTPEFENGARVIAARITTPAGSVKAEAGQTVTFNNDDTWVLDITTTKGPELDAGGLSWYAGDVTLVGLPVLYSGNAIDRVELEFFNLGVEDTDGSDGFSASFSGAPGGDIEHLDLDDNIQDLFRVQSSVYTDGQPGPDFTNVTGFLRLNGVDVDGTSFIFRFDNADPDGGSFVLTDQGNIMAAPGFVPCCSNNWVGASTTFASFHSGANDDGVGGLVITYFAGAAGDGDTDLANGSPVTSGAGLAGTAVNTELRAIAIVQDAFGNSTVEHLEASGSNPLTVASGDGAGSASIGIDRTSPASEVEPGSITHMSVFNGASVFPFGDFAVDFTDSGGADGGPSGFSGAPVLVTFTREDPNGSECLTPSVDIGNVCTGQFDDDNEAHPGIPDDGQFTYQAAVYDQAGNAAPAITLVTHADATAPVVNNVTIPSTLTGAQTAQFGVTTTDALDLGDAQFYLVFSAASLPNEMPFVAPQPLGEAFDGAFTTSGSASASFPFVRALEGTTAGAPLGAAAPADGAKFVIFDAAGNAATNQTNFTGDANFTPAADRDVATFLVTSDEAALCNGDSSGTCSLGAGGAQSATLAVTATGPTGTFNNPFLNGAVYIFRADGAGVTHLLTTIAGSNAQVTDDGTTRTWTWTTTFTATGLAADALNAISVIGVDDEGDGLRAGALFLPINAGS